MQNSTVFETVQLPHKSTESVSGLSDRLYRLTVLRLIGITTVVVSVFKRLNIATIVNEQNGDARRWWGVRALPALYGSYAHENIFYF